ncbi:ABC transporter permease [Desulfofundulus thermobenzoicus]|uniref:Transport permease protein n=1 Tax=Desulfofundulus thermobenzoicus TaxID=29376 RepID=A0A6N7IN25_9FIRM|nr:ABC transporter permease [Desulfofundulus thermobenzoicus]MQL51395.1 ABC transporter permease [Desulfofundulus thermobenzoicus]
MWQQIKEIYAYREMLKNLVAKELRARYKGSVFGFLWTFFNPLLTLVVYSVVFSFVMRVQMEHYSMFMFVGLLPWNYLATSAQMGAASIVAGGGLIKKTYFPREILPLSIVLSNLINYMLSLLILIPALLIVQVPLTMALIAFPVVVLIQTFFVCGLTLLLAAANVYFRDLEHITGVIIMAWFFFTPILYPMEMVPKEVKGLFILNPMVPVIKAYQDIFFHGQFPDWASLGSFSLGAVVFLLFSLTVFHRLQKNFAEAV